MAGPKISFSRLRPIKRSLSPLPPSGHRGDDRDLVLRLNLRPEPRTEPHVLVVQVHVDCVLAARKTPQRTGDSKLCHQIFTFSRNDFSVGSISTRRAWPLAEAS